MKGNKKKKTRMRETMKCEDPLIMERWGRLRYLKWKNIP